MTTITTIETRHHHRYKTLKPHDDKEKLMKARKVIIIRPSLFVRTIISAARIDLLDDTNKIPYSGGKNPTGSLFEGSRFFTMTQYSLHGCHKGTYS